MLRKGQIAILVLFVVSAVFMLSCKKGVVDVGTDTPEGKEIYATREQAKKYAVGIFEEKYPDIDLSEFAIRIQEDEHNGTWTVYASPSTKDIYATGGGGPTITFMKSDGYVLLIGSQK